MIVIFAMVIFCRFQIWLLSDFIYLLLFFSQTMNPLLLGTCNVLRSFVLWIEFTRRWLHRCSATKESINRVMSPHLISPFFELLRMSSFYCHEYPYCCYYHCKCTNSKVDRHLCSCLPQWQWVDNIFILLNLGISYYHF